MSQEISFLAYKNLAENELTSLRKMQLQVLHIHESIFSPPFKTEKSSVSETDTSCSVSQQLFSPSEWQEWAEWLPQQSFSGSFFSSVFLFSSSKTSLSDCSAEFSTSTFGAIEEALDSGVRALFGLGALKDFF